LLKRSTKRASRITAAAVLAIDVPRITV
jgi:hypothetical protein